MSTGSVRANPPHPAKPLATLTWHRPHAMDVAAHAAALLVALAVAVAAALHQADGHHVRVQPGAETWLSWGCPVGSGPCQSLPARAHTQPNPAPGSAGREQWAPLGPPTRGAESGGGGAQGPRTSPCGGCPHRQSSEEPRPAHPSPVPGRGAGVGRTQLSPHPESRAQAPSGPQGAAGGRDPLTSNGEPALLSTAVAAAAFAARAVVIRRAEVAAGASGGPPGRRALAKLP